MAVVTLSQVAKEAGVSIATASLAMRGRGRISSETRDRVLGVVDSLGYRTNASARALVSGRTGTIGVAVRNLQYLAGSYASSIVSGVAQMSDDNGFRIAFARSRPEKHSVPEYVRLAGESCFDGIVVIDQAARASDLAKLSAMNMPVVLVDQFRGLGFPTVRVDYRGAARNAANYLIGLGHRRIGVIASPNNLFEFKEKLEGCCDAFKEHGIAYGRDLIRNGPDEDNLFEWAKRLVKQCESLDDPPTAYLSLVGFCTGALCDALWSHGLRIPRDVSVVGFSCVVPNDSDGRKIHLDSEFVSLSQAPGYELGIRAAQLLLDLSKGHRATSEVVLDAELVHGHSCAPPGR